MKNKEIAKKLSVNENWLESGSKAKKPKLKLVKKQPTNKS
jgi:hypothetical protein